MKEFFKVATLEKVLSYVSDFPVLETEIVELTEALGRILAVDIISEVDLPDFARSTMDGYAVKASSTFGSSEANPGFLIVKGLIEMGESPDFSISTGEAAQIPTGGMLPEGADSVVMVEYTEFIDDTTIEVYKSAVPLQHVIEIGEDFKKNELILSKGRKLRAQEIGLLAALGHESLKVFKQPVVSIISTGDEIVPINALPTQGQIRDINSYTLAALIKEAGGIPILMGIVNDDFDALMKICRSAVSSSDMLLVSGGSSVGTRDFTVKVLSSLKNSEILVHGVSIKPGKPTILASVENKAFWGLPGHVVSAMVVFHTLVRHFIYKIAGLIEQPDNLFKIPALLTRNLASAQGRVDHIRVKLKEKNGQILAEPVLGKSGLINTMIKADGFIEISLNTEGLEKGAEVEVSLF
ncbi:Molybdopterin molybdenumtransferase [Candidatus Magnetomoraceae bacterium gMMP-1]